MPTAVASSTLLTRASVTPPATVPEPLLDELRELALLHDHCTARARHLYEQLRKMLGQDRLVTCLEGIQQLARAGEPAGARLLAACLDANTPGALLLPRIRLFRSVGRLLDATDEQVGEVFLRQWQARLAETVTLATERLARAGEDPGRPSDRPVDRHPLPLLRAALTLAAPSAGSATVAGDDLRLLGQLVRLEADAYQERVSRLAGLIDPFRVTAVMRALPLLNRADAEIRDLDRLAAWLESGDVSAAFERRVMTGFEVLDESERPRLLAAFRQQASLAPLATVFASQADAPVSVRHLAGPVARVLVLQRALQREGLRAAAPTLLDAIELVLAHSDGGDLHLPLDPELAGAVGRILVAARRGGSDDLAGVEIRDGVLSIARPRLGLGDRIWRHDLPTLGELSALEVSAADASAEDDATDDGKKDEDAPQQDKSAAAVKQLVMNNIGSVSIVLGFLRNPKVTAIPGLVADVVRRTRSGRVLEIIAGDRHLTSGHANKDVPRALLESPVNVPVKTLRKFIHVKYVSKTDLRRMAKDTARLRKEVCKEIEVYLESLT
jgi:hypothetical protein